MVRAISAATGKSWDETMIWLCVWSIILHDMPSANQVWGAYLRSLGFERRIISDDYTIADFCEDHPNGAYLLAVASDISGHLVYVSNGQYFDSWDSGDEVPLYYWQRKEG